MEHTDKDGTPITAEGTTADTNVDYEKRYKDLQAHATKVSQERALLKAENEALRTEVKPDPLATLSADDRDELTVLSLADPEAWRLKLNELERQATADITTKVSQATIEAQNKLELTNRELVFDTFVSRPDTSLSADSMLDLPPRLTDKLEKGTITFEAFLLEADTYLKAVGTATIDNPITNKDVNLGNLGGGASPSNKEDTTPSYEDGVY